MPEFMARQRAREEQKQRNLERIKAYVISSSHHRFVSSPHFILSYFILLFYFCFSFSFFLSWLFFPLSFLSPLFFRSLFLSVPLLFLPSL